MHKRARIVGPILLLALLAGGGYWWWNQSANANGASTLSGSGTIEAEDVLITSEVSGRVQSLLVDEGHRAEGVVDAVASVRERVFDRKHEARGQLA